MPDRALDENRGSSSIRTLAESLSVSRHTVRQYRRQDEAAISAARAYPERTKVWDGYRDELADRRRRYPRLSARPRGLV